MEDSKTAKALRTLNLTLNLANTELGLTRDQLQPRIDEYSRLGQESFQRTFERDIASLREAGLEVQVIEAKQPRYKISGSSFPAPEVAFSAEKAEILGQAAAAWTGQGQTDRHLLLTKLTAFIEEQASLSSVTDHNMEGGEYLAQIVGSIERRQPLRFTYDSRKGREERDVAPWSLLFRGRAAYLIGFDLNRWAPRRFRLSRIQSELELVAEPGAYEIPDSVMEEFEAGVFRAKPLLWIESGQGKLVRLHCGTPLATDEYPDGLEPRPGWDLVWGEEDDQSMWERLIISDCVHAMPAEDTALRRRIVEHLRAAAVWGEDW